MTRSTRLLLAAALGGSLLWPVSGFAHDEPHAAIPQAVRSGAQMTLAATAFVAGMTDEQRTEIILPFSDDAARSGWSNVPTAFAPRTGLPIARLTLEQRGLMHQMLIASTSSQGYQKIWGAVRGDDALREEGEARQLPGELFRTKNNSLGASNFYVTVFGDPTEDASWGYMLTGHHLGANFTVVNGQATFVPMFYGSDPATIAEGPHAGHVFLPQERRRGFELLSSLDADQKAIAVIADAVEPDDEGGPVGFYGAGADTREIVQRGIAGGEMTDVQQRLLWQLIEEYVGNSDFDVADEHLDRIRADGIENVHFMWMGPTDGDGQVFYRVSGPSILIDFIDQRTPFDWNTHPHAVVRDPTNDYGAEWLGRHISESH